MFRTWSYEWHVPPKRWLTFTRLHGIIFQKMDCSEVIQNYENGKLSLRSAHDFLLIWLCDRENGSDMFLRHVGLSRNYTTLQTTEQIFIVTAVRTEIPYDFVLSVSHFLLPEVSPFFYTILVAYMYFLTILKSTGARGSVADWCTMLQTGRSRDRVSMRWIFSIYLILPGALWPWGRFSL
jgi:hypothetical protein